MPKRERSPGDWEQQLRAGDLVVRAAVDSTEEFGENEGRLPWAIDYTLASVEHDVFVFQPQARDVRGSDEVPAFIVDAARHKLWEVENGPSVTLELRRPKKHGKAAAAKAKRKKGGEEEEKSADDSESELVEPQPREDEEAPVADARGELPERSLSLQSAGSDVWTSCFEWSLRMRVATVRRFEEEVQVRRPGGGAEGQGEGDGGDAEEAEDAPQSAKPRALMAARFLPIRLAVSRSWLARRLAPPAPDAEERPLCADPEWLASLRAALAGKGFTLPPDDELTDEDVVELGPHVGRPVEEVLEQVCCHRCWADAEETVRARLREAGASERKREEAADELRELRRDFAEEWRMEVLFADPEREGEWWWREFGGNKPERPADVVAHVKGLAEAAVQDLVALLAPAAKGKGAKKGGPSGKPPPALKQGKGKAGR
eukprot:tig00000391_g24841.t1